MFLCFTCKIFTNTMLYSHDVFSFFPDFHKSPTTMAVIEEKNPLISYFREYSITTGVWLWFCCWTVAGRSEINGGTFYLVKIGVVFMKSQNFDGQKLVRVPTHPWILEKSLNFILNVQGLEIYLNCVEKPWNF